MVMRRVAIESIAISQGNVAVEGFLDGIKEWFDNRKKEAEERKANEGEDSSDKHLGIDVSQDGWEDKLSDDFAIVRLPPFYARFFTRDGHTITNLIAEITKDLNTYSKIIEVVSKPTKAFNDWGKKYVSGARHAAEQGTEAALQYMEQCKKTMPVFPTELFAKHTFSLLGLDKSYVWLKETSTGEKVYNNFVYHKSAAIMLPKPTKDQIIALVKLHQHFDSVLDNLFFHLNNGYYPDLDDYDRDGLVWDTFMSAANNIGVMPQLLSYCNSEMFTDGIVMMVGTHMERLQGTIGKYINEATKYQ